MVGGIHDQVLTHDGQTNQAKITTGDGARGRADIDAGQSRSKVSKRFLSIQCVYHSPARYMKYREAALWQAEAVASVGSGSHDLSLALSLSLSLSFSFSFSLSLSL